MIKLDPRTRLAGKIRIVERFEGLHDDHRDAAMEGDKRIADYVAETECIERDVIRTVYRKRYDYPVPDAVLDDLASLHMALEKSESLRHSPPKRRTEREIAADLIAGRWSSEPSVKGAYGRIADELSYPCRGALDDDYVNNALDTAARRFERKIMQTKAAAGVLDTTPAKLLVIHVKGLMFWDWFSGLLWQRAQQHHDQHRHTRQAAGAPMTLDDIDGFFEDGLFVVWLEELGTRPPLVPSSDALGALFDRILRVREERHGRKLKIAGVKA
jgi:hypothetical protein